MKRMLTGIVVTIGLVLGTATGASAVVQGTVPNSPLDSGDFSSFGNEISGNGVAFMDEWEFVYGSGSLEVTLENDNGFGPPNPPWQNDITGLTLEIWTDLNPAAGAVTQGAQVGGITLGPVPSGVTDGMTNPDLSTIFLSGLFTPGDYAFLITGTTSGTERGRYNVEVGVVPLPPAIWLFLSALVGLVSFARIRRGGRPA